MKKLSTEDIQKIIEEVGYRRFPDEVRRRENILNDRRLCKVCSGTGNEVFFMFKKCEKCEGLGYIIE